MSTLRDVMVTYVMMTYLLGDGVKEILVIINNELCFNLVKTGIMFDGTWLKDLVTSFLIAFV